MEKGRSRGGYRGGGSGYRGGGGGSGGYGAGYSSNGSKGGGYSSPAPPVSDGVEQGKGGKRGKGKGLKGGGKGGGKGGKPFWRQFVDASDDPEVVGWCRQRIQAFLDSGQMQQELSGLSNSYRNTLRDLAPEMGAGWRRAEAKGVYALVRCMAAASGDEDEAARLRAAIVAAVKRCCVDGGGRCKTSAAFRSLPAELAAYAQAGLKMRKMQQLPTVCAAECAAAGVRLNERGNALLLEGVADDDGCWYASIDAGLVRGARVAVEVKGQYEYSIQTV